ncbi:transposase, partial [Caenibacillus caldisaponilyticus]|uniref:transposase n=1 Tax=Caenibacillus caldisaponilyticus TaxID=1674942 RepID=UPI000988399E
MLTFIPILAPTIILLLLSQDQGLAKLLEQVLNQILEAQLTDQLGAGRYERTEERKGYRNGS